MITIEPVPQDAAGQSITPVLVGPRQELARKVGRYLAPLPNPLGPEVLIATGDGVVTAKVDWLDGKPALRFLSCPDLDVVYRRLIELKQLFLVLDAATADVAATSERGRCRVCGCTTDRACLCGCWWADDSETLCRQHGT